MKITCQSCQAKYTIADEKVLGKTVKIKCKKCGASIVVHGSESSPGLPEPGVTATATATPLGVEGGGGGGGGGEEEGDTRVNNEAPALGAPSDEWTVNVTEDDQRTLTSAQIAEEYQRGVINGDSYVWKDGMADWLPLSSVPELMQLIAGAGPAMGLVASPDPYGAPAITEAPDPQYGLGGTLMLDPGQGQAGTPPPNLSTPAAGAAARRAGNRPGGVDLFASSPDRQLSDPGLGNVGPTGERHVGERNESSVLFSLSALNAAQGVPRGPANKGGEDGVLDLRPSPGLPPRNNGGRAGGGGFDDIMNLGGGISAAPNLAPPPLLAPVVEAPPPRPVTVPPVMGAPNAPLLMPEQMPQKKNYTGLLLGIIGVLVVLGGVGAFFAFSGSTPSPTGPEATTTTAAPSAAPSAAPAETAAPTAAPAETTAAATTPSNTPGTTPVGAKPGPLKPGTKPAEKPEDKPVDKPAEKPPEKQPEKPAETAAPAAGGKEFDRAAAMAALSKAAGGARSCKKDDGPTGSGKVKVTFAPSGNVTSATVDGPPFAGTPVGGCIASAFRGAHVPPFEGAPVSVSKTVNIN